MSKRVTKKVSMEDKSAGQFALEVSDQYVIPFQEIRCPGCGRFLGYQAIVWGAVKLKCTNSKCRDVDGGKTWITIDISPEK